MKKIARRTFAKSHSIKPNHFSKTKLIKSIQAGEGNFDCFATAYDGQSDKADCLWRDDCFKVAHK